MNLHNAEEDIVATSDYESYNNGYSPSFPGLAIQTSPKPWYNYSDASWDTYSLNPLERADIQYM